MHIDFKITTWERCEIPEDREQEILQLIKEGKICSGAELADELDDPHFEPIEETDTQMYPKSNGGWSTLEVYEGKGEDQETLYKNGK